MGAKRLFHPAVLVTAILALTLFGGTGLALSLRPDPSPTPRVRFQPWEQPGGIKTMATSISAPVSTPKPTHAPAKKVKATSAPVHVVPTARPVVATPKPAPSPLLPVHVALPPVRVSVPTTVHVSLGGGPANNTAVLIGLNHAAGSEPLEGMVEDTKIMRTMLLKAGFKNENITVLTDGKATKSAILSALDRLASRTSGKGLAVVSISSHSGMSGGDMTFATGGGGRVSRTELASRIGRIRGRVWTTISTCYSGAYDTPGITGPNRLAIFTASKDELSYQNAAGSVTIVYMIQRAMLDNGIRSVEDAYAYATTALNKVAPEKTPIMKDGISGDTIPGELH